jgi:hypothetical protein
VSLIRYVRVAGTGQKVPAEIMACSFQDMVNWQRLIHDPFIAPAGGIGADWDWPAFYLGCNAVELASGRALTTFQIRVPGPTGRAVPVAQCMVSMPYAYPGPSKSRGTRCNFVWFAAATPLAALQSFGVGQRFAMLAPMLDTAIMLSVAHGLQGRIGLHAAPGPTQALSEDLVRRYTAHGMSRRPAKIGWFRFFTRREDGRLFYLDEASALAYAAKQDDLR